MRRGTIHAENGQLDFGTDFGLGILQRLQSLREAMGIYFNGDERDEGSELAGAFLGFLEFLKSKVASGTLTEGEKAEVNILFDTYLPVFCHEPQGSESRFWDMLSDIAAIWSWVHADCAISYYYKWRRSERKGAEVTVAKSFSHTLLGTDSPWGLERELELKQFALEFIAGLLVREGDRPTFDLAGIDPNSPLTPPDFITLATLQVWFERDLHRPEMAVKKLAEELNLQLFVFPHKNQRSMFSAFNLWGANSVLFRTLVERWQWSPTFDFKTDLNSSERVQVNMKCQWERRSREFPLTTRAKNGSGPDLPDSVASRRFSPSEIAIIGLAGTGKTSYIASMVHLADTSNEACTFVGPGREMQDLYEINRNAWERGEIPRTTECTAYSASLRPRQNAPVITTAIADYCGQDLRPGSFPPPLQKIIDGAKGLFFMIDDRAVGFDTESVEYAERLCIWFRELLYWKRNQPLAGSSVPVALIVNKADILYGDEIAKLGKTRLIDETIKRALFYAPVSWWRMPPWADDPGSIFKRLAVATLQDPLNNVSVGTQNLVECVLSRFQPFIEEVLRCTDRFQIFLTCSRPVTALSGSPMGIMEPLRWWADCIYDMYLKQCRLQLMDECESVDWLKGQLRMHLERYDRLLIDREKMVLKRERIRQRMGNGLFMMHRLRTKLLQNIDRAIKATDADLKDALKQSENILQAKLEDGEDSAPYTRKRFLLKELDGLLDRRAEELIETRDRFRAVAP